MTKNQCVVLFLLLLVLPLNLAASVEVIGSLKQVFTTNPGEVVKGQIQIQNSDNTDQEVRIYQTDLMYNFQDQTYYDDLENSKNIRSNGNWVQYSPKTVVLKPKEIRNVEYEITVPAADTTVGTFWSVIMVEGISPINPTQTGDLNIRTSTRYAVLLVNEMSNKGLGLLKFMEPTLVKGDGGKLTLAVDMQNDGKHYISPELSMELYDQDGNLVKTIKAEKRGLYPGTSTRFLLDLAGIPTKKTYTAMIVAAGQDNDVFGLEYTLYF